MKVAGWAEAHYIDLMPHNPLGPVCTAATIHLAAAVANFAWLEVRVTQTENLYYGESGVNDADASSRPAAPRRDRVPRTDWCPAWASKLMRNWRSPKRGDSGKRRTGGGPMVRDELVKGAY